MEAEPESRYEIVVRPGPPRGDLFELEQRTIYQVVDRLSGDVVLAFESLMEASLSRDTGLWDHHHQTGVAAIRVAADESTVVVTYHDGRIETIPLP
jgi:hypothetical protein